MMMRAIRISEPGQIQLVEAPLPQPGPGEVQVRLTHAGYCGSDLASFEGRNPLVNYPRVPGHELAGAVSALGEGADSGLALGQAVTILPYFNCGACFACRAGTPNACLNNQTMGVQREGAMAQFTCVPVGHVIPVEGLDAVEAALIEPLAISFHAVERTDIRPGETVAVLGMGMIGTGMLLAALAKGARVIAVDVAAAKLELALGLGIARCFLEAGAELVLAGTNAEKLVKAQAALGGTPGTIAFDITETARAESIAAEIESRYGPVSVLVNNAGNTVKKPAEQMSVVEFESVLDTHVVGAFALTRALLPQLRAERGSILFTASMSSFLGIPNVIGYSAAKSAHVGMVRALATELAPQGVRVNGVAPGWIRTPLFEQATSADPQRLAKIRARIPMDSFGEPEDIGHAMVYLASKAARYVTGEIIAVDGGALHGF